MSPRTLAILSAAVLLPTSALAVDAPHTNDCMVCHSTHASSYPSLLATLCETCHFEGGPATAVLTHSSRTTDDGYGDWDLDCWACHDAHSQEQLETWGSGEDYVRVYLAAQVKEINPADPGPFYEALSTLRAVYSDEVRFTGPTEYVDGDGTVEDDICQVCHLSTTNYGASSVNTHGDYGEDSQPGGDCSVCHAHTNGFAASGGGGCTGCHASAQGDSGERRQVAGAGGDFERLTHHVTDGTTAEIVTDADCEVCHDQSDHQTNGEPAVLLNDPDGGVAWSYDGSGGSIEGFCLACHDADSSQAFDSDEDSGDGYQPFVDGLDPTDVASTWAAGAHGSASAPELADEGCLACHGGEDASRPGEPAERNAHGSAFDKLLSPVVAGRVLTNAEEELCYACHDGSVTTDIESMHPGIAQYVAASGASLNSNHDLSDADQTWSGAVMECGDCHDAHSGTLTADPDPTDGVVPAAGNNHADSTLRTEWCIDCHDGTYPVTITPPTEPLLNIWVDFYDSRGDQHGADDGSNQVSLRAGSGYAKGDVLQCTDCHNAGHGDDDSGVAYANYANLKSVVYSKDGSTPLLPDDAWDPGDPFVVRVTDISGGNTDKTTNGTSWCSTCHQNPMGGNKSSGCLGGNCHNHGMNSF